MTQNRPVTEPRVLAIAATEAGGVTGLNADLRMLVGLGVHPCTAVTATTAQAGRDASRVVPVADEVLRQQLAAVFAPGAPPVHAVKIGLVPTLSQARVLAETLAGREIPVVLDPVAVSSLDAPLTLDDPRRILEQLLPLASLVTPNLPEAALLLGQSERDLAAGEENLVAGVERWRGGEGAPAVLVKGGHRPGTEVVSDLLCGGAGPFWLRQPRLPLSGRPRGTGCALASAIASALAQGFDLSDAVVIGRAGLQAALRSARPLGEAVLPWPDRAGPDTFAGQDLPALMSTGEPAPESPFPDCGSRPPGLYPIVDRARWLERLLPQGVDTIQIRIKDLSGEALRDELARCVALSRHHGARLFVNDHWQLALELGAYGVHLGQEDLHLARLDALRDAGLRLGLSSHCHWEFARARGLKPSYIATGPVFPTTSKDMPWRPQGFEGVVYWRRLWDGPLVAIGGIEPRHCPTLRDAGADGIAMISAITASDDPEAVTRSLLETLDSGPVAEGAS